MQCLINTVSRINVWAGMERPFKKTFFFWIKLPCIPLYSSFFTNCSYPKIIFLLINLTIKSGTLQTLQEFVYFFLWFWELVFWSRMNICYIYRNHSTAWNTKEDKQILLSIEIRLLIKKIKLAAYVKLFYSEFLPSSSTLSFTTASFSFLANSTGDIPPRSFAYLK